MSTYFLLMIMKTSEKFYGDMNIYFKIIIVCNRSEIIPIWNAKFKSSDSRYEK